ncbi:hypothetical protein E6C60_0896 [Paenibacillus algicola]|uniref:Uncharacterized protein n=1 Tax=Paenibacillus algicola TaxID=2565926 RepID=A0A4P8XGJ4_9BACL|nr:hypothetical protein E6C60_0896 [Paenibacillus algicola]
MERLRFKVISFGIFHSSLLLSFVGGNDFLVLYNLTLLQVTVQKTTTFFS